MKKIIEKIIRIRNRQFRLHKNVTGNMLAEFSLQQVIALLRGCFVLFGLRLPKLMLRESGVKFFNMRKVRWGKCLKLGEHVYISALGSEEITFGNNVSIGAFSRIIISTTLNEPGKFIRIGNNVGIGEFAYLGGAGGLQIDDDCIIGQYFSCHPENHNYKNNDELIRLQGVTRKGISIGKNCWIGSKVTILDGVIIGNGCVIAAGAVITKSFADNSIIGGVPAKLLGTRTKANTTKILQAV